jgi:hypothetical protein
MITFCNIVNLTPKALDSDRKSLKGKKSENMLVNIKISPLLA